MYLTTDLWHAIIIDCPEANLPGYSSACLHVCGHKARLQTLLPTIRKIRSAQRIIKRDIDVESNLNEKVSTIKFIILTKMTLYIFQYNLETIM